MSGTARRYDLVVIGASAGGVETLKRVVAGLPADFPATVCIVLHLAPSSPSALARILDRAGPLACRPAEDGERLRPGVILVAPPDRHLVVEDSHVRVTMGPRYNGHRPSVDALFRTAADALGERVIGVVLSGTRDDGSVGLAMIKAHGGATIVQDPDEALYSGMPASALASVAADAIVPSTLVAQTITAMVTGAGVRHLEPVAAAEDPDPRPAPSTRPNPAFTTVCPECGGVLNEQWESGVTLWKCPVGHRYSPDSLIEAQAKASEATLWAAIRALQDHGELLERLAGRLDRPTQAPEAQALRARARYALAQSRAVRDALTPASDALTPASNPTAPGQHIQSASTSALREEQP